MAAKAVCVPDAQRDQDDALLAYRSRRRGRRREPRLTNIFQLEASEVITEASGLAAYGESDNEQLASALCRCSDGPSHICWRHGLTVVGAGMHVAQDVVAQVILNGLGCGSDGVRVQLAADQGRLYR